MVLVREVVVFVVDGIYGEDSTDEVGFVEKRTGQGDVIWMWGFNLGGVRAWSYASRYSTFSFINK